MAGKPYVREILHDRLEGGFGMKVLMGLSLEQNGGSSIDKV
jgi:hypothetical protein